ncbi:hypothetical protein J8TS2_36380 [Lederbergia ruris]|uniref:Ribosomal protein L19 n=1 Tax=Lederbergia ruris TaxID=217495 RepID=A0ABQ4KQA8_9BACI|nr:hypothetical protein J8TS2_36380 [Lederbergia ruris]
MKWGLLYALINIKAIRGMEKIRTVSTVYKMLFVCMRIPYEIKIKNKLAINRIDISGVKKRLIIKVKVISVINPAASQVMAKKLKIGREIHLEKYFFTNSERSLPSKELKNRINRYTESKPAGMERNREKREPLVL